MKRALIVVMCIVVAVVLTVPALAQSNTGALAPPQWGERARSPGAPTILVYEDYSNHWQQALGALGLSYNYYTDAAAFAVVLNSNPWDLVCINQSNYTSLNAYWGDIEAYLDGGGKLIVFNYTMGAVSSHPLWAKMGAQWEAEVSVYEAIAKSDSAHSVWQRSNVTPTSLTGVELFTDNGDYMSALPGARAVGWSGSNVPTQSRIICREDQRTVLNSFLPYDYNATDTDADGTADITELMMNEVIYVLNKGWSILVYQDLITPNNPSIIPALDELGLVYTLYSDTTGFLNDLNSAQRKWALVCVDQTNYSSLDASWGAVNTYLGTGGRLVIMNYTMGYVPGETLWANMGASWQSEVGTATPIHRWLPSSPIFAIPASCPDLATTTQEAGDNGDYILALTGATALAGLNGGTANQARVIMRNDARTFLDAWLAWDFGGPTPVDANLNTIPDATEWLMNQIAWTGTRGVYTYYVDDRAMYSFEDISATGNAVPPLTDDGEYTITIPFDFWYYGLTFNTARIGANGAIGFEDIVNVDYTNRPIPINRLVNYLSITDRFLAPFWDDLYPPAGGNVYYEVRGSAPFRRLIVQWNDIPHIGSSPTGATFQIILYEGWNFAVCYYADMNFGNPIYDYGASATVGFESDFANGVQHSYNSAVITDGLGVVMTPWGHAFGVNPPQATPANVVSGGTVNLSGGHWDFWLHDTASWTWSRSPTIGTIDDPSAKSTTWTAPMNNGTSDIVVTFTVDATCTGYDPLGDSDTVQVTLKWDYDGDGIQDAWELANGLNPQSAGDASQDPDNDSLTNLQEYQNNTNPHSVDTDGDGFRDMTEVYLGSNPANAGSKPAAGHFNDVPANPRHWAFNEVEAMVRLAITSGCSVSPPLYCSNASITRAQMAVFLCRAAGKGPLNNPVPTFADVPLSNPYYGYVERLANPASWGGNPPTTGCAMGPPRLYCPSDPVTRAQMSKFLCIANSKTPYNKPTPTFADVPASHPFYGYIERLADPASWSGGAVTSGCDTGPPRLYCPASNNTRAQMAVFLLRAFELPY